MRNRVGLACFFMATSVFGAIQEKFDDSKLLAVSAPGGLWDGVAQEKTKRPYVVFQRLGSVPSFMTEDDYYEREGFEFRVHGGDDASVYAAMEDLKTVFDPKSKATQDKSPLRIEAAAGEKVFHVTRTNALGPFSIEDNPSAWQGNVEYEVWVQKRL